MVFSKLYDPRKLPGSVNFEELPSRSLGLLSVDCSERPVKRYSVLVEEEKYEGELIDLGHILRGEKNKCLILHLAYALEVHPVLLLQRFRDLGCEYIIENRNRCLEMDIEDVKELCVPDEQISLRVLQLIRLDVFEGICVIVLNGNGTYEGDAFTVFDHDSFLPIQFYEFRNDTDPDLSPGTIKTFKSFVFESTLMQ